MGFFSKIKKLWSRKDDEPGRAPDGQAAPDDAPQRGDDVPPAVSAVSTAPAAPDAPAGEAAPGPSATAPAAAAAPSPSAPSAPIAPGSPAPAKKAGPGQGAWRDDLILALREAEPRLSVWLSILLRDVDKAGPELWERLRFLFSCLEAPTDEAEAFVTRFGKWLADMEYVEVEEFRSELQYRLALALDLEDEEDERSRLLIKLSEGLARTKEQISARLDGLMGRHALIDEAFWEELEEILLMADLGYQPTAGLLERLKSRARRENVRETSGFRELLRLELAEIFKTPKTIRAVNPPEVVMVIGVNGVGKTTTIAKLAYRAALGGRKTLIAAGDTFRAAAIEQLQIWAGRAGADFYAKGADADPAAVAFEAMDKALREGHDLLILDTAGRLHTKANLMEELKKISRVLGKKHPGAPHRTILVIDATTGQNALSQTKLFNEAVGVDEIILTKLDGTAKGGVIVGVALEFGLPISFVGLGEKMEDLRPFSGQDFAQALLGQAEAHVAKTDG